MMVLGALVLLGLASLGINHMLADKTIVMLEAEASLNATSIAQIMIDEVMTKSYDASTAGGSRVWDSTQFTSPAALGPNATETGNVGTLPDSSTPFRSDKYYNDVDDYNNYSRVVKTPILGKFTVVDTVYYLTEANLNVKSSSQTYYKKVLVTVRHPNMSFALQLSDVSVYRRYF